jgi:Cytochrome bd terminal oxidase subunit I
MGVNQQYLFQARQMRALSLAVHIPLVCFGIAFPVLVLFAEWRYLRTGDQLYRTLARRWSRIMLALFAVGVVTAVVIGWAAAQAPRFLPGMTVAQAAAGRETLVALVIAVACGSVILLPSLALLYTLFLRGRLDTPETRAAEETAHAGGAPAPAAGVEIVAGSPATEASSPRVRAWSGAAVTGLVAGTGLLVFADYPWAHVLGVAALVVCAISVFLLAAPTLTED